MTRESIVVIGAGIVGAAAARMLQLDGHVVTLLDREGVCAGASYGNAGAVVTGSCAPTAMPGILRDVLHMIGRPLSPFTIRPRYLPTALPWLLRFLAESRRSRVEQNAGHLHALTSRAEQGWRRLTGDSPLAALLRPGGWLKVYETEAAFARTAETRRLMDRLQVPYDVLEPADIQALEPELAPIFECGLFQPDSLRVTDPGKMVEGIVDAFVGAGGTFRHFAVERLVSAAGSVRLEGDAARLGADRVVIAAGARSAVLAEQAGDRMPLDTERGYHLMLPESTAGMLQRPVMNGDHSFVLSPLADGLRITSQVEFAGVDAAPDYRRVRSLLPQAARMLPGLQTEERSVWMGCRPSLPDSLPVIGFSTRSSRVMYAFGHQHLGMTLGPVTGCILADLVAGRDPGLDLRAYRPDRF